MTPEQQAELETLADLFLHPGWKLFLDDVARSTRSLDSVRDVRDADDLFYRQGQLNVVDFVLSYEETMRTVLDSPEDAEEGEA